MKQQLFTTDDAVSTACAVNTKHRGRLLAMAAGILSVLILLVTAMQFVISAGADRYSEYSNSCRKYMMAFMKNDSTYSQLVNATRLPYRNYVESLQRDQGFLNSLTAWKAANLDLSGGVSEITQSAEYKYYLGILMDLMTDTVNETDLLDAANAYMDALHISLAKQSVNTLKKYNELSMKVDKEDSETLLNEIGMLEEASDVLDLIGDIGNVIEKANNLGDLIDKISQLCAIHDLTKGYSEVMRFMCDACDSDNIALKSALAYMRDVTSGALTEEMASAILTGQTVADDALKSVLGAVKKSVLSVMGYGGTVISFAQSLSKYVANQLFATDNIQSAFYKSRALYDIEDLLRLALKGTSSADRFFAAFSLYENVMYKGADYSVSYYKAVYEDSIFGKVFAWIQGNGDAASKFKSMMSDEKDRLKVSFDNLQRRAYNGYKGLAHTSEVGNLNVRQEYIIPDLSDLVENDAQLNKLSIETYGLPDEDYTLTEDMTLYANVYHSNGTIDLNGHSLTILGDLVLEGGCVKINGGQLNISGDYNAAIPVTNSDGTTGYKGGYLDMGNINDKVTVSGDFNTCYDYDGAWHNYLKLGTIETKGNLNDYYCCGNGNHTDWGIYSDGTKFIFSGSGEQTVTASDGYICFENVDFQNPNITFIETEISCYIEKDETVNGDLYISEIDLKGHKLTVNGNLQLRNKITLNGGELYIAGDYNAAIPVKNSDGTTGYTGGYLDMGNINDKVTVSGDFNTCYDYDGAWHNYLKLGTIETKGNLNDYYCCGNGNHTDWGIYSDGTKFIFSGSGEQTVTASDGYICFENVDFQNPNITFIETEISCYIEKDETVNGDLYISEIDLKGHKLTVNGNLQLRNKITLNGGELYIAGDYNAAIPVTNSDGTTGYTGGYLDMGNVNDKVTVDGDFNTYRDNDNLDFGTIEIKGNLNDYYCYGNNNYTYNGLYSDGTKFIFSGKGKQTINATDGYIYFQKVDFVDTKNREIVVNCEINIELCGDAYITGDNATVRGNLNGYALNVSKNLTVNDTLDIQGGCLNVKGNLYNYGAVNLGSGSLIVNGNYNAYKSATDTDGTVTYSNGGYLHMGNINDKVTVDGDFNTYYDYEPSKLELGTIEIKGNLNDYYDGSYSCGLCSYGTKFIFSGTGKQTITAKEGYIKFENVEFVNKDTTGSIEFDNTKMSCHIEKDETVTGNLCIEDMDLKGHKLTVNGDLKLWNRLSLGGGELYITGNYDAYIPVKNADGTTSYTGGYLHMGNINDKVTVDGDFNTYYDYEPSKLELGTIEIKGNLNDYYDGSYSCGLCSYGTKFIFSGTGKQTITAKEGYIKFENVEFVNKDTTGSIEFDNTKMSCHIEKDETVTGNLCIEDMDLKGHKLTVNGNLKLWSDLSLGGGELYITGNYDAYIPVINSDGTTSYTGGYLDMGNVNDKVTVDGDFNTYTDYYSYYDGYLKLGSIEIKGNLNDYTNYDVSSYGLYSDGTKFIFSGTGKQTITALDGELVLNTAEFVNKNVQIDCSTEIDVDVPVRAHDYSDEWTVDVEAACNDGSKSHHCTRCDAKTDITVIPATGKHSFGDWKITKAATCTAEGTQTRTCSVCKKVETQTIEALGHTEVTDKAVAATCTKTGLTEGKHCSVCDAVIKAQTVVPAKGHTEVIDKAVAATCTKTGLTEGKHCSVCNAVIKAQETVPATGKHSFGNWKITKAATCTADGTQTRTCSVCGKVETQTIAKTAHKYVNTVVKPTYTAQGYTLHKCSVCGTSYKDTYTAKLTLAKVTGVKLGGRAADALRINWTKNANADGYIVEMYQGGKWARVAKITNSNTTTYRKAGLKAGTVYKFRVRAYKMSGSTAIYSDYSAEIAARTNPSVMMTGAKLGGRAADALRINWSKNASADGYIVEMYQGNKWVRVAKITNNNTTTFRKAGLKASTVYKFRVRAYKMSGSTALYGNYSATVTARTNPSIVKGVKIGGKAKDALRVNWAKNASAQGYIVEMYKGGKWVRVAKITNSNTTTFRKAGLAKNTAYKFRVRAYHMSGKTALYGNYGSVSGKTAAK